MGGWDGMVVVTACEAAVRADVTKLERYRKTAVCNYVSFRFDYVHTPYTALLCRNNRGSRLVLVPGIQGVFSETQYNKKSLVVRSSNRSSSKNVKTKVQMRDPRHSFFVDEQGLP